MEWPANTAAVAAHSSPGLLQLSVHCACFSQISVKLLRQWCTATICNYWCDSNLYIVGEDIYFIIFFSVTYPDFCSMLFTCGLCVETWNLKKLVKCTKIGTTTANMNVVIPAFGADRREWMSIRYVSTFWFVLVYVKQCTVQKLLLHSCP